MSGVLVMGEILRAYAPLIAVLPESLIRESELPQGAQRGIVIESLGVVDRNVFGDALKRRVTERVQVTVFESDVRARRRTLRLVRSAGAARVGDYADVTEVSVLLAGTGPAFRLTDPIMYLHPQDFMVSFNEPA